MRRLTSSDTCGAGKERDDVCPWDSPTIPATRSPPTGATAAAESRRDRAPPTCSSDARKTSALAPVSDQKVPAESNICPWDEDDAPPLPPPSPLPLPLPLPLTTPPEGGGEASAGVPPSAAAVCQTVNSVPLRPTVPISPPPTPPPATASASGWMASEGPLDKTEPVKISDICPWEDE